MDGGRHPFANPMHADIYDRPYSVSDYARPAWSNNAQARIHQPPTSFHSFAPMGSDDSLVQSPPADSTYNYGYGYYNYGSTGYTNSYARNENGNMNMNDRTMGLPSPAPTQEDGMKGIWKRALKHIHTTAIRKLRVLRMYLDRFGERFDL